MLWPWVMRYSSLDRHPNAIRNYSSTSQVPTELLLFAALSLPRRETPRRPTGREAETLHDDEALEAGHDQTDLGASRMSLQAYHGRPRPH